MRWVSTAGRLSRTSWRKPLSCSFLPRKLIYTWPPLSVSYKLRMFVVYSLKNKCADAIPPPCRACGALHENSYIAAERSRFTTTGAVLGCFFVFLFFLQLIALFYRWMVFLSQRHCERSMCVYRLVLDCEPVESVSGCLFLNTEVIAKNKRLKAYLDPGWDLMFIWRFFFLKQL